MSKKVAVVLSGCGVFDGAEIYETVITLLALDRQGAEALICAPDIPQLHVVNHWTGEVSDGESRNVLVESARIARGEIRDIASLKADEVDALILPGGFGAAKNLCDFAIKGAGCAINGEVARLVREVHDQDKPIAAVCIAPAVLAKALAATVPKITIGNDPDTADALEELGAQHINCPVEKFVVDPENKLITSPAYMLAGRISEAAEGIEKTVAELLRLA